MINLKNINIYCKNEDAEVCQNFIFKNTDIIWYGSRNQNIYIISVFSEYVIFCIYDDNTMGYCHTIHTIDDLNNFNENNNELIEFKKLLRIVKLKKILHD